MLLSKGFFPTYVERYVRSTLIRYLHCEGKYLVLVVVPAAALQAMENVPSFAPETAAVEPAAAAPTAPGVAVSAIKVPAAAPVAAPNVEITLAAAAALVPGV